MKNKDLDKKIRETFPFNTFEGETLNQLVEATCYLVSQGREEAIREFVGDFVNTFDSYDGDKFAEYLEFYLKKRDFILTEEKGEL